MKKSYKWSHDKWNEEEHPRDQRRQRSNAEEPRKLSKQDSSRRAEDYFEDENKSVGYQSNSYQMERRSKTTIQTYRQERVIPPRFIEAFEKFDRAMKSYEEEQCLNDAIKDTKKSDHEENKVRHGAHPLCPKKGNSYPDFKNQNFKNSFSKPIDARMKFENEFSQVDDTKTECFNTRRNSDEMNINEGNPSKDHDVKHMHSSDQNSLAVLEKYRTSFYESNQSTQYISKQYDDQSYINSHDFPQNHVCTFEESPDSQSDNTSNASQRSAFLNFSAPHERCEFSMLKLIDLLYYNANLMQDQALFNFSTAVKCKILEAIHIFPYPVREELEVLCEITDGDQSEKNQQIITTRTCRIVRNIIEKFPHVLNTLERPPPPPTQILVYQTMPNLHGMTNICYNDNKSSFLKIVQNSEVLLTSTTDSNLMSDYKIAQNDKCVTSKTTSDSFDNTNSDDYKDRCEIHNFNTNDVENSSTVSSSLIVEENRNKVEASSKSSPVDLGERKLVQRFSLNEDDNCFTSFDLDKLLNFNINAMQGDEVFQYAFSMKQRILAKINCFKDPYKDKLKLLCELTDGTQREHNQKLINERMCDLIYDFKDEIGQNRWQIFLDAESKDEDTRRPYDENEMLHGHRQNIDGQSRKMHLRRSYDEDEVMHKDRQNLTEEQSKNVHPRRSHEMVHEHQQNFSDVHSRRLHESMHAHRQKFSDEQPKNVHPRRLHDEVMYEHNQNLGGQSRNVHLRQSHDEVMHVHRQNFTDEQSKKVQSRKLYSDDEVVLEHRQKFSEEQPRNIHPSRSDDEVVHEHNQNFSGGQSRNAHLRQSREVMHVHRQNFTGEQSRKVQSRKLYSDDEVVFEHRQNISDEHSKIVQHEHRQNFSGGQSRNVHLRQSHYKDETVQQYKENVDGQSRNAHTKSSHYSNVKKR